MNVLVYLEERNGQIRKPSLEAISAAQSLGATTVNAVVVGSTSGTTAQQAQSLGFQNVYVVHEQRLEQYSSRATAKGIAEAAKQSGAAAVIIAATSRGRDLAPRVGIRLDAGYVPDVIAFKDGVATHPVYAGKALMDIRVTTGVKVYSTRPNLWKAPKDASGNANIQNVTVSFEDKDFAERTKELVLSQGKLDVAEADVIVSGGRGMKGPENWALIEQLAEAFGAATGASRAVVDAGWRPHGEQVGQTGKTVSPTLYVAVGISGAVQHLAGMSSSKTIVAINKDPNAPIFQLADYGIIGDAFEILPTLTEEIKKLRH